VKGEHFSVALARNMDTHACKKMAPFTVRGSLVLEDLAQPGIAAEKKVG